MRDRKTESLRQLELMLNDSEGFLPICSAEGCKKVRVLVDGQEVWIGRDDDPSLYDRVIEHYGNSPDLNKSGFTHTVCPEDGKRLYGEYWEDRKTILYAEDHERVRELWAGILRKNFPECDLEPFSDGGALEARLRKGAGNIGVVITDGSLPIKTGYEIIRQYAQREDFRGVPFILHSTDGPTIGNSVVEQKAFAYLDKIKSSETEFVMTVAYALNHSDSQPTASSQ